MNIILCTLKQLWHFVGVANRSSNEEEFYIKKTQVRADYIEKYKVDDSDIEFFDEIFDTAYNNTAHKFRFNWGSMLDRKR